VKRRHFLPGQILQQKKPFESHVSDDYHEQLKFVARNFGGRKKFADTHKKNINFMTFNVIVLSFQPSSSEIMKNINIL
jgi:hypothetical protein